MKTLLQKIKETEAEATAIVKKTETVGKRNISDLLSGEEAILEDIKNDAEKRGESIIKERVKLAQDRVNSLKQDEAASTTVVHEAAKKNRSHALKVAWHLFSEAYL